MIPLRLVLDTNIIISAALRPDGLQRTVLLLALEKPARLYLECADAARADYLITGNRQRFPKFRKKTKVITPREFIEIVGPHPVA